MPFFARETIYMLWNVFRGFIRHDILVRMHMLCMQHSLFIATEFFSETNCKSKYLKIILFLAHVPLYTVYIILNAVQHIVKQIWNTKRPPVPYRCCGHQDVFWQSTDCKLVTLPANRTHAQLVNSQVPCIGATPCHVGMTQTYKLYRRTIWEQILVI